MFAINRNLELGEYRIADLFPDIRKARVVREIFGSPEAAERVLAETRVHLEEISHYMSVDNEDGAITVGISHLREGTPEVLYLDIVHELVHVKQHQEGLDLYDRSFPYVDRQTEIDAYALTVKEARRIGLSDEEIFDYLSVEWITPEEHRRLAGHLNVRVP